MHDNDPNDTKTISAMTVMTRRLNKSLKCSNHTIQTQMHNFGKGSGADRVTQSCLTIKPNTPGIAARMAPGSGPAPQGRKPKDRSGESLAAPSTSGQPVILARADNPPKVTRKRPHDFTYVLDNNLPGATLTICLFKNKYFPALLQYMKCSALSKKEYRFSAVQCSAVKSGAVQCTEDNLLNST